MVDKKQMESFFQEMGVEATIKDALQRFPEPEQQAKIVWYHFNQVRRKFGFTPVELPGHEKKVSIKSKVEEWLNTNPDKENIDLCDAFPNQAVTTLVQYHTAWKKEQGLGLKRDVSKSKTENRKTVFAWLDEHPEVKNKELYVAFSGLSTSALRTYKSDWKLNQDRNLKKEPILKPEPTDPMEKIGIKTEVLPSKKESLVKVEYIEPKIKIQQTTLEVRLERLEVMVELLLGVSDMERSQVELIKNMPIDEIRGYLKISNLLGRK